MKPALPGLKRLSVMQFFGIAADHSIKQAVLLSAATDERDLQGLALVCFATPFLLWVGPAGRLCDRADKRRVLVMLKWIEVAIMAAAVCVFCADPIGPLNLFAAMAVLALMASQSAFLTPAKYGILVERYGTANLNHANAAMQITGHVAILVGVVLGSVAVVWRYAAVSWVGFAIIGLAASITLPPHGHALTNDDDANTGDDFVDATAQRRSLWRAFDSAANRRRMIDVMLLYGGVWWLAGLYQPIINVYATGHLGLSETATGGLLAFSVVGIAAGCWWASRRPPGSTGPRQLRRLVFACGICQAVMIAVTQIDRFAISVVATAGVLGVVGVLTGMLVLPLHVSVQTGAPRAFAGRLLAIESMVNWIAIIAAGVCYVALSTMVTQFGLGPAWLFIPSMATTFSAAALVRRDPTPASGWLYRPSASDS